MRRGTNTWLLKGGDSRREHRALCWVWDPFSGASRRGCLVVPLLPHPGPLRDLWQVPSLPGIELSLSPVSLSRPPSQPSWGTRCPTVLCTGLPLNRWPAPAWALSSGVQGWLGAQTCSPAWAQCSLREGPAANTSGDHPLEGAFSIPQESASQFSDLGSQHHSTFYKN